MPVPSMVPHSRFSLLLTLMLVVGGCNGGGGILYGSDDGAPESDYPTQPARIYVDESMEDWADLSVRYTDPKDDVKAVDLERLWVAHSDRHLFLRIEVEQPLNLQEDNALTLYLDTDDDSTTGKQALGLGVELSWTFGERSGQVFRGTTSQEIGHADLGLTSLPTVRAETFEIALNRSAKPLGAEPLFRGDSLRIALLGAGDRLPGESGGLGYVLSDAETSIDPSALDRPTPDAVRLLSYNVPRDALFEAEAQPHYRRILEAVGPDVVGFQEIYEHTAGETGDLVEGLIDGMDGWAWAKGEVDLVVGSRYPIRETHVVSGYEEERSFAALLDAETDLGSDLLVVVMHPPCCNFGPEDGDPSSNAQRQQVVEGVVAFLRDVKQGHGPFEVAPNIPIVIMGDMNFVGDAKQPRTLRTGGSLGPPDWDASSLLDTNPRQTATPMHTTWIDAESSFPPGRLDYAYVTDSVLEVVHEYVLYTPALSEAVYTEHGLRAQDTREASDHLPVVIDVVAR